MPKEIDFVVLQIRTCKSEILPHTRNERNLGVGCVLKGVLVQLHVSAREECLVRHGMVWVSTIFAYILYMVQS